MRQQLPTLGISPGRLPSAVLIVAVLATLFAPALVQLAGRQTDSSFLDNRPPARMPAWPASLSRGALGQFRTDFINFVDDNFGLRAEMLKLNIRVRSAIGVSAIPGLFMGKEGWFFLKTDSDVLDQVRAVNRFTDQELDEWIDLMEAQQRWVKSQGSAFIVVIAPNQHSIYPEYLPRYVNRVWPETRLDQIMRRLQERRSSLIVVDPRRDLWAAKEHALLYHKYEDHWNALGAFLAYSAAMKEAGKLVPAIEPLRLSDYAITPGYRVWSFPPVGEADPILRLKSGTRVVGRKPLHNASPRPIIETTTQLGTAPTALVYGDSFGDVMEPFFNETFHRTTFVPRSHWLFPTELIQQHKPDVVIVEMVERHLAQRPPVSEAVENEYLLRLAPTRNEAIARSAGIGGTVAGVTEIDGRIEFVGWVADHAASAKLAVAYYEARAIGAGRTVHVRLDTAPTAQIPKIGFRIPIPADLAISDAARLRFFSTTPEGEVYELEITPTLRQHLERMLASPRAVPQGSTTNPGRR